MGQKEHAQDVSQDLRVLGLTIRESEVVFVLLQSPAHLGANEVAQRTGIARPYVHDLLRKLVKMNVVTRMKGKTGRSVYSCSIHNLQHFAGGIRSNYEEKLRRIEFFEKTPNPEAYISRLLEILGHSAESYSVYSVLIENGEKSLKELAASTGFSYSRIRQIVSDLTVEGFLNRRRSGINVLISATFPGIAVEQACKIAKDNINAQIDEIRVVLHNLSKDQLSNDLGESAPLETLESVIVEEFNEKSSAKILIVEDHDALRESLVEILIEEGNEAQGIGNASDALSLLQNEAFDIVISDIKMPGMDGIELLRRVRERDLPLDFVIITGFGTLGTAQEAIRLGAKDYILKPLDPPSFVRVISDVYKQQKASKMAVRDTHLVKKRLGVLDRKTRLLQQAIQELMTIQIKSESEDKFRAYLFVPEQDISYKDIRARINRIFVENYPIFQFSAHYIREEPEILMSVLDQISESGVKAPKKIGSPMLFINVGPLHDYCDPCNEIEIHETVLSLIRRFFQPNR
jgi:CheY-like chemotaxis protein/DNA-binding MarR family transcriptional regulator